MCTYFHFLLFIQRRFTTNNRGNNAYVGVVERISRLSYVAECRFKFLTHITECDLIFNGYFTISLMDI